MRVYRYKGRILILLLFSTVLFAGDPGLNAFLEEKFDTSLAYYLKRLEDDPDNTVLHYNAGTSALKAGRSDLASSHFDKSLRYSEDREFMARNWYNQGHLKAAEGELEEALKSFEQAILLNPEDVNSKVMYELVKAQLQEQQQKQEQDNQKQEDKQEEQTSSDEKNQTKESSQEEKQEDQNQQEKRGEEEQSDPQQSESQAKETPGRNKEEELTRQQMVNLLNAMREKEKEAMKEILRYRYKQSKIEREKDW